MALPTFEAAGELAKRIEDPEVLDGRSPEYLDGKKQDVIDKLVARGWAPLVEKRLAEGLLSLNLYTSTICEAVLRVVRNPDGYKSEVEGNYQYELWQAVASGWLFFSAENMADLFGSVPKPTGPIGTAWTPRDRRGI